MIIARDIQHLIIYFIIICLQIKHNYCFPDYPTEYAVINLLDINDTSNGLYQRKTENEMGWNTSNVYQQLLEKWQLESKYLHEYPIVHWHNENDYGLYVMRWDGIGRTEWCLWALFKKSNLIQHGVEPTSDIFAKSENNKQIIIVNTLYNYTYLFNQTWDGIMEFKAMNDDIFRSKLEHQEFQERLVFENMALQGQIAALNKSQVRLSVENSKLHSKIEELDTSLKREYPYTPKQYVLSCLPKTTGHPNPCNGMIATYNLIEENTKIDPNYFMRLQKKWEYPELEEDSILKYRGTEGLYLLVAHFPAPKLVYTWAISGPVGLASSGSSSDVFIFDNDKMNVMIINTALAANNGLQEFIKFTRHQDAVIDSAISEKNKFQHQAVALRSKLGRLQTTLKREDTEQYPYFPSQYILNCIGNSSLSSIDCDKISGIYDMTPKENQLRIDPEYLVKLQHKWEYHVPLKEDLIYIYKNANGIYLCVTNWADKTLYTWAVADQTDKLISSSVGSDVFVHRDEGVDIVIVNTALYINEGFQELYTLVQKQKTAIEKENTESTQINIDGQIPKWCLYLMMVLSAGFILIVLIKIVQKMKCCICDGMDDVVIPGYGRKNANISDKVDEIIQIPGEGKSQKYNQYSIASALN